MKTVEPAIFELLKSLNSNRVYPLNAPQNATAPFIVYNRVDSERWRAVNGPSGIAQATIQVDVYAATYQAAKELALSVENTLDGHRGLVYYGTDSPQEFVRIAGISLQNDVDLLDQTEKPLLFRNSANYLVTYEQTE